MEQKQEISMNDIKTFVRYINFVSEKCVFNSLTTKEALEYGQLTVSMMDLKHKLDNLVTQEKES